ncbi:MAG: hypothetical protein LBK07_02195, partial [Tannerella sp.]|nr:hypothetical protein [Tannerella sp.]
NHIAFHDQITATWNYISPAASTRLDDFGYINGSAVLTWITTVFQPEYQAYNTIYLAWHNPAERTRARQAALDDAEPRMKQLYRQLYGLLRGNPLVRDDDLVRMAMPTRHTGGNRPVPGPSSLVDCEIELVGPGVIHIHWFNKGAARSRAKPYGMRGVEVRLAILDAPPVDWDELLDSRFDTRSPLKLTFTGADRGKTLYFALRWENTTGVKGDWSEIYSARIP